MTGDLTALRRFFAEELQAVANLRSASLVDAFATVPRERFLRPGPWSIKGEGDFAGPTVVSPARVTPDADPRHVYHNIVVGIDPSRQLFNGQPALIGRFIDELDLRLGARVLHVGCGLGYYSAIMAQ